MRKETALVLAAVLLGGLVIYANPYSPLTWEIGISAIIAVSLCLVITPPYIPPILMFVAILITEASRKVLLYSESVLVYVCSVFATVLLSVLISIMEDG